MFAYCAHGLRRSLPFGLIRAAEIAALIAATPWAAADTWDNSSGDAQWSTNANWVDNMQPASTAEAVLFPNPGGFYNANITLSNGEVCGSLTFDAIYNFNGGTLNVGGAGGPITVNPSVTATINSVLSGTQGLTKSGTGTLTLGGANTFTGDVTLNAGTVKTDSNNRLGNSGNDVVINAGTLQATADLSGSRSFTLNSASAAMTVAGFLQMLGGVLDATAGANVASGIASVSSGGTATLSDGSTWDNSGTLFVGNASSIGTLRIESGATISDDSAGITGPGLNSSIATVTGSGSTWSNTNSLGVGGGGSLRVEAAGSASSTTGGVFNGGIATVTGLGSNWTNSGAFQVGSLLHGFLTIADGGSVSGAEVTIAPESGDRGRVDVTGTGSALLSSGELCVGKRGEATLSIAAGGRVENTVGIIGDFSSATGTVTVDGANSQWINSSNLRVGVSGDVTLEITDGGHVQNTVGSIASFTNSTSVVTVDGAGSRWLNSNGLTVGDGGSGTLNITDAGRVESATGSIGNGSTGIVTVSGNGSEWAIAGALAMSSTGSVGGTSTLNIIADGAVTVGGDITDNGSGVSTLTLDGGTLDLTGHNIGGGMPIDSLNFRSGTLRNVAQINNGVALTKTTAGTLILDTPNTYPGPTAVNGGILHVANTTGSATGTGTVTVASVATLQGTGFVGGPVQNNGSVAPGASAGVLTIQNPYTQSASGTLEIEIGGTTLGSQYDRLTIVGDAALDGILDVALVNGFVPVAGQQFTILTATSIVDNGLALGGSAASAFSLLVTNSSVILQAVAAGVPGDYNNNGTVDAADYVLWRKGGPLLNEVDTPGTVNAADYTAWRARFGNSASGAGAHVAGSLRDSELAVSERLPSGATGSASATIPEPSSLVLACLGVAGLLRTARLR